jgi:predicted nucleic acid-binding protein
MSLSAEELEVAAKAAEVYPPNHSLSWGVTGKVRTRGVLIDDAIHYAIRKREGFRP